MGPGGISVRWFERAGNWLKLSTLVDGFHEKLDRFSVRRFCDVAMPVLVAIVSGLLGFVCSLN